MKQSKIRFLLLALLLAVNINIYAEQFEVNGIKYDTTSPSTVEVIEKLPDYKGDIVIPESINYNGKTYSVTSIGSGAFSGCSNLTSVTIGNCVTFIGSYAFKYCSSLTSVTIGVSVTSIGYEAFKGCNSIASVTILCPSVGSWFSGIESIKEVVLGNNVISIGLSAFEGCSSLTSVTIPNSVTSIGDYAFSGCSSLTSVTIPNCVKSIGYKTFLSCYGLKSMTIGNSVTSIDKMAFSDCRKLTSVTIPNSVTSIGEMAFRDCYGLTSLTIGNSVTSIGINAFSGCSGLTSLTIPNSVTSIGQSAFGGCSGLTSLTIGNSVISYGTDAFMGCSGLISVFYDSKQYRSYVFRDSKNLKEITLGENVEEVEVDYEDNLLYLRCLSKTPPKISGSNHVDTLEVPYGYSTTYAKDDNWNKIPLIFSVNENTRYYPVIITSIGGNIVSVNNDNDGCEAKKGELVEIKANSSLANNPLIMFGTQNVSNSLIKNGYCKCMVSEYHSENTINSFDFPLTSVTLSESGTLIDKINLDDILNIENLKITGNINGTDLLVIRKMENLKLLDLKDAHIVEGGMSYYKNYVTSKNKIGNDFFSNKKKLYTVILPQDITEICEDAFGWCYELRTISIPKTVNSMNASIFPSCYKFHSVHIEDLTAYCSIKFSKYVWSDQKRDMYLNDKKVVDVVIPDGIKSISAYAFYYLNGLKSLVIPSSVTKIGNYAFDCPIQESITCYNPTPPEIDMRTFGTPSGIGIWPYSNVYDDVILYVPKGSKTLYWLHPYWEWFKNIVELDDTSINDVSVDQNQQSEGIYTIDGVKLSANAYNTDNLPKGIYIINGKKVVIK